MMENECKFCSAIETIQRRHDNLCFEDEVDKSANPNPTDEEFFKALEIIKNNGKINT